MKESDVQRQILDYLALKHLFHYRNNSGAMVSEYRGKKRFMRFGATGSPDIVCVVKGGVPHPLVCKGAGVDVAVTWFGAAVRNTSSVHSSLFRNVPCNKPARSVT
jgi:hypothetical protein